MSHHQVAQRTHHSLNPVKSEGGRSSQQNRAVAGQLLNNTTTNSIGPQQQGPTMSVQNAKGRLSSQMSPDERSKIQELRRKISEATKSNHGPNSPRISAKDSQKAGSILESHPSLHQPQYIVQALSSNRRANNKFDVNNGGGGHASSQLALDFSGNNSPQY